MCRRVLLMVFSNSVSFLLHSTAGVGINADDSLLRYQLTTFEAKVLLGATPSTHLNKVNFKFNAYFPLCSTSSCRVPQQDVCTSSRTCAESGGFSFLEIP